MKKLFVLSFASILLLTGCGATETLSCSYRSNANNGSTKVTYDIDHEEDEIKKVRITYNYDFNDNTTNNDENNNARVAGDNNMTDTTTDNNMTNTTTDNNMNNNGTDATTDNNMTNTTTDNNMDNNGTDATNNNVNAIDGVGTGTDGTTNDTQFDDDGIVDGVVGSAIDTIVGGVTSIILDSAGLRDRHSTVQDRYGNVNGFSVQNTNDTDNNYKVTYVIDYDTITDADLASFNLTRSLDDLRTNYVNQGFTCK